MKRWNFAALTPLLLLGLAARERAHGPSVIEMTENMAFVPRELSVMVGEIVVWRNVSTMSHTVNNVSDYCKTDEGRDWIRFPKGATLFYSDEIKPEAQWRHRFDIPGRYQYLCTFHENEMMRGTILVEGAK
jgi:plastocyanin